jgi:hypothetical protein
MRFLSLLKGFVLLLAIVGLHDGTLDAFADHVPEGAERLEVVIFGMNGVEKRCYFDAEVTIENGAVLTVQEAAAGRSPIPGTRVEGLAASLSVGRLIPGPVFLDEAGRVLAGYESCEGLRAHVMHHSDPPPVFGWLDLFPGGSGHLSYRAWTVYQQPVPTGDAWLIVDNMEVRWEAPFDYALASAGLPQSNFKGFAYNQQAEVNYARMETIDQVRWICGTDIVTACFEGYTNAGGFVYTNIVYGPLVWQDPPLGFEHGLAHEFGHGFSLKHHVPLCGYVMSPDGCSDLPVGNDIATALEVMDY